jgi:hypothetical protein
MLLKNWTRSILAALLVLALPALSNAQVSVNVSVGVPPPELPVYDQPPIPGDGYVWTPGYWAWSDDVQDYYWVPGTWVLAPQPEYLWTPGYWGGSGAAFIWHAGYWGPHVGFYGGVNYGYGYGGAGYEGGYWQGGHMYYNRSVTNISNTNVTNVYNKTVINNVTVNRVSYNGGNGGVQARPTAADEVAARDRHIEVTPAQRQHEQTARSNPQMRVSQNKGHPAIAATPRPGAFSGAGVVSARPAGTMSAVHPNPEPRPEHEAAPPAREVPPHETAPPRETAPRHEAAPARAPQPAVEPRAETHPAAPAPQSHPQPAPPPHQNAAPPRPAAPAAKPKAEPHPPERKDEHDHH